MKINPIFLIKNTFIYIRKLEQMMVGTMLVDGQKSSLLRSVHVWFVHPFCIRWICCLYCSQYYLIHYKKITHTMYVSGNLHWPTRWYVFTLYLCIIHELLVSLYMYYLLSIVLFLIFYLHFISNLGPTSVNSVSFSTLL